MVWAGRVGPLVGGNGAIEPDAVSAVGGVEKSAADVSVPRHPGSKLQCRRDDGPKGVGLLFVGAMLAEDSPGRVCIFKTDPEGRE